MDTPSIPAAYYARIIQQLDILEKKHDIRIIYAIENGSRLTGLWHEESDFDIRFVFTYNRKIFNTVNGRKMMDLKDTIEGMTDDEMLDWQGWCVDKAIDAIKCSNPSIIEWTNSNIVYRSDGIFIEKSRNILKMMFNVKSLYYHYLNMAKKNWEMHIKDKKEILYKKYLYVMRPLLMLIYIQSDIKGDVMIINDFYDLLKIIKSMNEYLSVDLLEEMDKLIYYKQHDKGYIGPPLIIMNRWIEKFFESEDLKVADSKKTEHLVLQGLQSCREKVSNDLRKVNAIGISGIKKGLINRGDYLSLFGQYTMYMWLIQHPDKTMGEAPQNINNLLKEIKIDSELAEWIHHISVTRTEICDSDDSRSLTLNLTRTSASNMFLNHMKQYLDYLSDPEVNDTISELKTWIDLMMDDMEKGKIVPRDDMFDHCFRSYLSILWLTKSTLTARSIPKDIFSDKENKDVIPLKLLEHARNVASDLRPVYTVKYEKRFHDMIQKDLIDTEDYVSKMASKYMRKKEIDKQELYKGSFESVDPMVFLEFLEYYII
jgi:predicted nucleotidyltransferase